MEYVPFCRNKNELRVFENFLKSLRFTIFDLDQEVSISARSLVKQLALSHSIEMGDALIAATAMKHSIVLCTSNSKYFKPVAGIEIHEFTPGR